MVEELWYLNDENLFIYLILTNYFLLQNSPFFQMYDINLNEGILGDGTFSICRKCRHKQTGKEFAVKIVSRRIDCTREIQLLRLCQGHPNIVKLHEVFHDEVGSKINFEQSRQLQIWTEF